MKCQMKNAVVVQRQGPEFRLRGVVPGQHYGWLRQFLGDRRDLMKGLWQRNELIELGGYHFPQDTLYP